MNEKLNVKEILQYYVALERYVDEHKNSLYMKKYIQFAEKQRELYREKLGKIEVRFMGKWAEADIGADNDPIKIHYSEVKPIIHEIDNDIRIILRN